MYKRVKKIDKIEKKKLLLLYIQACKRHPEIDKFDFPKKKMFGKKVNAIFLLNIHLITLFF